MLVSFLAPIKLGHTFACGVAYKTMYGCVRFRYANNKLKFYFLFHARNGE